MKARLYLLLLLLLGQFSSVQAQQFYVNTVVPAVGGNKTYYLNADSCDIISDSTNLPIYTCYGSGQYYTDIAVDSTHIWYVISYDGLYSRRIDDTNSCKYIGSFQNGQARIVALVADTIGNIYAAGGIGDTNILFKYSNSTFSRVGNLPDWAVPIGDLFFYQNRLFMTCHDQITNSNILLEVDSIPEHSCYYMPIGKKFNALGAFTIKPKEGHDRVFITGTHDGALAPSYLIEVDMVGKTLDTICTYPFTASGAASYHPAFWDSTTCPPPSDIGEVSINNQQLTILNPSTDNIRISTTINNADIKSIHLYDISGRRIKNYYYTSFPNQLDISDIPNGLYVLHIKSVQGTNRKFKVIKQ